ncbi:hypothetical protein FPOA_02867 [Fusarium poae]|uniref:Uncharacterized protein n=1 Tax=Fusarium poae TaxID=36050 RepID=A0A1B8B893_FUSPO|nr:hypothetical protein FPOA_02867 [Fusarium poae]
MIRCAKITSIFSVYSDNTSASVSLSCHCLAFRFPSSLELLGHDDVQLEGERPLVTTVVKTFSNLLNSTHHPFAGARCSADSGGSADSTFEQ